MIKTICSTCKYEWTTKSNKKYVSCPNCLQKTKIEAKELKQTPDALPINNKPIEPEKRSEGLVRIE